MRETGTGSAPLAALGALLAALAVVGLAHGSGRAEPAPPLPDVAPPRAAPLQTHRLLADRPIELNTATAADLELLPRIGPTLAGRIVASRAEDGPFLRVDDLLRVRGVGPRTLERLRPLVAVDEAAPAEP